MRRGDAVEIRRYPRAGRPPRGATPPVVPGRVIRSHGRTVDVELADGTVVSVRRRYVYGVTQ